MSGGISGIRLGGWGKGSPRLGLLLVELLPVWPSLPGWGDGNLTGRGPEGLAGGGLAEVWPGGLGEGWVAVVGLWIEKGRGGNGADWRRRLTGSSDALGIILRFCRSWRNYGMEY